MSDLFRKIEDQRIDYNIDIWVTFLEIYNEEIRDLLAEQGTPTPRGGLQIREDKSVKVVGLVELHPTSADQIKEIVLLGNTRRTQSPTHANETSSRSHAVLQVHVSRSPRTASTTEQRNMATLSIIDLAGSERAAATTNMGQRMVEGANINKSLLALGNCINALCESGGATRHVPYRNSKLTRLLKFSLGGNCKTVMIVCIAPASNHFDDTHNTLLYADRASKIKTKVVTRNVVNVDRHVGQYVEAINRLNTEVAELKARLAGKLQTEADSSRRKKDEAKAEAERSKEDMQRKSIQTQPSIVAGAACEGKLATSRAMLRAYNLRLEQINTQDTAGQLSSDIIAEQMMLRSLASAEEAKLSSTSEIQLQIQRSRNTESMFDALLHAVTHRRSDRLDEINIDNVKLDAQYRKAEMDRLKAESFRDSLNESVVEQSTVISNLVGMLTRITVMLGDGSKALGDVSEASPDIMVQTVKSVSASLHRLADSNNAAITRIFGRPIDQSLSGGSSLLTFSDHSTTITPAIQINSQSAASQSTRARPSRRLSNLSASVGSPGRRGHRNSPRKSSRSSIIPGKRVVSDKPIEKRKAVQWKDEVGQGDLDDGGLSPLAIDIRTSSPRLSESEWEDDKTEESVSSSFMKSDEAVPIRAARRPRSSRLDPSFLKSRGASTLSSLAEDDETNSDSSMRRGNPFMDRMNHLPTPQDSSSSSALHVPKGRERDESPARRVPSVLKMPSSTVKQLRRRSNIGPLRHEKVRRRSSLLPTPSISLPDSENVEVKTGGARRVPIIHTPSKRPKRASLLGAKPLNPLKSSVLRTSGFSTPSDPNGSDSSFRGSKPTWR